MNDNASIEYQVGAVCIGCWVVSLSLIPSTALRQKETRQDQKSKDFVGYTGRWRPAWDT